MDLVYQKFACRDIVKARILSYNYCYSVMKKLLSAILVFSLLGIGYYYKDNIIQQAQELELPVHFDFVNSLETKDTLPGPLKAKETPTEKQTPHASLSSAGVVTVTNTHREAAGLPHLTVNAALNRAAQSKLNDMFAKQYFEHESPEGLGPADLAKEAGYAYVLVGENLALGNFANDQDLLQGWMDSPGHRANILNPKYREIGVAVGQGMYEGKKTWMAVQEFGTPLSSCPSVDASLKQKIESNEAELTLKEAEAQALKAELESGAYNSNPPEYNKRVEEYNNLVHYINTLVDQTKALVVQYNAQVAAFNNCIAE